MITDVDVFFLYLVCFLRKTRHALYIPTFTIECTSAVVYDNYCCK